MKYFSIPFILPFFFFLVLGGFLWKGLSLNPKDLSSVLIGQPSPSFSLITVEDPNRVVTEEIFRGKITLLNVWSTWCTSCKIEHKVWMDLVKAQKQSPFLSIVGLNYHDILADAQNWLQTFGNPYYLTIFDEEGRLGIDYGVYGTPETFILDMKGLIRYRHAGPINDEIWQHKLLPIIESLSK